MGVKAGLARWAAALALTVTGVFGAAETAVAQAFGEGNYGADVSIAQGLALPPVLAASADPTIVAGRALIADLGLSIASTTLVKRTEQADEAKWAITSGDLSSARCRGQDIVMRVETWIAPRGGTAVLNDVRLARFSDCRAVGSVLIIRSGHTGLTSLTAWYPIWATPSKDVFLAARRDPAKATLAITVGPEMGPGRIVNFLINLQGRQVSWTGYPRQAAYPALVTPAGGKPTLLWADETRLDAADGAQAAIKFADGSMLAGPIYNGACGGDFAIGQFACAPGRPAGNLYTLSVPTTMNGAPPAPGALPYGRYLYLPVAAEPAQDRPNGTGLWPSEEAFYRPLLCPAGPEPPPGWLVWRCSAEGRTQYIARPPRAGGFATMVFQITDWSPQMKGVLRERRSGAETVVIAIAGPFVMRSNGPVPDGEMNVTKVTVTPQTGSASAITARSLFRGAVTDAGTERLAPSGKGECAESLDATTYAPCEYFRGLPVSAIQ